MEHKYGGKIIKYIVIDEKGTKRWYQNGQLHRDNDKPAVIYSNNGKKEWYQNGKLHRNNDLRVHSEHVPTPYGDGDFTSAAIIWSDGSQFWYKNGQLHRDNDLRVPSEHADLRLLP